MNAHPVLVEAWRGDGVDCTHCGALAVVNADGGVVLALGDTQRPIFPRSAVQVLTARANMPASSAWPATAPAPRRCPTLPRAACAAATR